MAKNSMVEREKKRTKTVAKYAAKRAALKEIIGDRCVSSSAAASLRHHGSSACGLSQVRSGEKQAS